MQATYVLQNIYTVNNLHRLKTGTVCSSKGMVATYKITRCHKIQAQKQEFHILLLNILSPHIKRDLHWMKPLLLLLPSHKLTRSSCGIRCNADRTRNTYQDAKIFIGIVVIICYENRFFNMRNPMDHTRLVKLQLCRLGLAESEKYTGLADRPMVASGHTEFLPTAVAHSKHASRPCRNKKQFAVC
jgi:hypothetical protein